MRDQGVALVDKVPRPPGYSLPPGATESAISEFESSTGLPLPIELREWLSTCNAPCIGPGGLYGIAPARNSLSIREHLASEPEWIRKGWIPVAGDGNGDYYVLDSHTGAAESHPVYFLDHEISLKEPAYIVASNLWQFLRFLLQAELDRLQNRSSGWPFNEASVLKADPELGRCGVNVPLPWECV